MLVNPSLRVLVVDDERPIRLLLRTTLGNAYIILEAENGNQALQMVAAHHPDLVLLDLGLPDMEGMEVIQRLREWSQVPVIVLSVRDRDEDKADALDLGADDYLTKPFSVVELMARMRTALRHGSGQEEGEVFLNGELSVDLINRQVAIRGQAVTLTPTEYEILRFLVTHAGKVITHKQLMMAVWGSDYQPDHHLLRVNVSNLRKKLEKDPARPVYIITEPGVGYRLRPGEEARVQG